jgi:hypothetical protein
VKKLRFDELGIIHMQSAADKLRKKVEKMNDSFVPSPEIAGEENDFEEENQKKTIDDSAFGPLHGHWKYTGPKDTVENPWRATDPEKTLARNVDLVDDKQKLKQLDEAIKICSKKLVMSKASRPWMYTGPKDTIENMVHVDHVDEWVPFKYNPKNLDSDEEFETADAPKVEADKPARNHPSVPKFNVKEKTRMYEKEYSEIKKYPWKFKFEDYMEEDNDDDSMDYPGLGGGNRNRAPRGGRNRKNRSPSEMTPNETISDGEDIVFAFDD